MDEILKKIDEEILVIKRVLVSGTFTEEVYGTLMGKVQMAERIKEIILSQQKEPCEWILEDEDNNTWECSKCGELWQIISGTPKDNNMNYCSKCGSEINKPHQDIEEVFNRR